MTGVAYQVRWPVIDETRSFKSLCEEAARDYRRLSSEACVNVDPTTVTIRLLEEGNRLVLVATGRVFEDVACCTFCGQPRPRGRSRHCGRRPCVRADERYRYALRRQRATS